MRNQLTKIVAACALTAATAFTAQAADEGTYRNNRYPLLPKAYIELPIGAIHAEGWMEDQLNRMREGMTGHLDQVYEHVMGPRNGWLGGDGDVWERGPYWIDGLRSEEHTSELQSPT